MSNKTKECCFKYKEADTNKELCRFEKKLYKKSYSILYILGWLFSDPVDDGILDCYIQFEGRK